MGKDEKEIRNYPIEFRATEEGKLTGYASVFNQWSEDLGWFKERVRPGAFKKSIKESDIRGLFNHDPNYVLGRNKSGTLELVEDSKGLKIDIDPPDTQWARDLVTSIRRGDIDQMSFGFNVIKDEWNEEDKKNITRELVEIELFDVSPVTYPAYPQTSISVRDKFTALQSEPGAPHSDEAEEPGAPHSLNMLKKRHRLKEIELTIGGQG